MATNTFQGDLVVTGDISAGTMTLPGGVVADAQVANGAEIRRAALALDALKPYPVNLTDFRVWDAMQTNLPGTAAADDLALIATTFGTTAPKIQAGDLKAAGATTRYARALIPVPAEYIDGETIQVQVSAGMTTTVADTTCVVDIEAYELDLDGGLVGSPTDICATAAQSMNSLTFAELVFNLTPTNVNAGDILDCRVAITCTDAATGTAVIPTIAAVKLLADVRG